MSSQTIQTMPFPQIIAFKSYPRARGVARPDFVLRDKTKQELWGKSQTFQSQIGLREITGKILTLNSTLTKLFLNLQKYF